MTSHLSTLTLHRVRYGELDGPVLVDARAHLADCPECQRELEALQWTKQLSGRFAAETKAPAELRAKILRDIHSAARPAAMPEKISAWHWLFQPGLRPYFATAALVIVLGAWLTSGKVLQPKEGYMEGKQQAQAFFQDS